MGGAGDDAGEGSERVTWVGATRARETDATAPRQRSWCGWHAPQRGGESPNPGPRRGEPDTEKTRARVWSKPGPHPLAGLDWLCDGGPARARLVEVVGARPCRTQVKRREAFASGEPASSGEAQFSSETQT